jgi:hypothetical protein
MRNGLNSPAAGIISVVSNQDAAGNIIQILANLPDFLRKPMLQGRLHEFFAMSEQDRQEMISMALNAAPGMDPAKLGVLVRTWLEVLCEFEPEKRMVIFGTYANQALKKPEQIAKLDFASLTRTFLSLDEKEKEKIIDSLHEVLFAIPERDKVLKLMPEDSRRALKLAR